MSDSIIEDSILRFFSKALDTADCVKAEKTGELPAQWTQAVENGFTNLLSPEAYGGAGISWPEALPLFTGLGYCRVPLPLGDTVIAHFVANTAGQEVQTTAPIALVDEVKADGLTIVEAGAVVAATGTLLNVPWARASEKLLMGLRDGRIAVWDLKNTGCTVEPGVDISKLPSDTVVFENAPAEFVFHDPFPHVPMPVRHLGALGRAAMLVGAAQFALETSVQYALDRVQFGRPIGKNQAIQQQLAQMAGQIAVARHATALAFQHVSSWDDDARSGSHLSAGCAKVLAGEAADTSTAVAHQVLGAIGFTYEHVLNFSTRRLWTWREEYGTSSWWSRRIGNQVVHAGADDFWPALTRPNLYSTRQEIQS